MASFTYNNCNRKNAGIMNFLGKVDTCFLECPYSKNIFVPSDIVKGSDFAFIGEQPGDTEVEEGRVFCGRAGTKLDYIFSRVKIDRVKVSILNSVKCFSVEKPPKEIVELCSKLFLAEELKYIRPKVIVPMGDYALRGTLGVNGITANRGLVLNYPHFTAKVVPTYHPAFLLRNPRQLSTVIADFKQAKRVLNAVYTPCAVLGEPSKSWLNYKVLDKVPDIIATLSTIKFDKHIKSIAVDTETTGLESWRGHYITALGVATKKMVYAIYLYDTSKAPVWDRSGIPRLSSIWSRNELHLIKVAVRDLLEGKLTVFQNSKFDLHFLIDWCGLNLDKLKFEDTMVLSYLLNEEGRHDLEAIAAEYTEIGSYYKRILLGVVKEKRKGLLPLKKLCQYVSGDASVTKLVYSKLRPLVRLDAGLNHNYTTLLKPLIRELIPVEKRGVKVNINLLRDLKKRYKISSDKACATMQRIVGKDFNPASYPQLLQVLQNLGLPFEKTTNAMTVNAVMHGLGNSTWDKKRREFLKNLIVFRKDSKVDSTFINGVLAHVDSKSRVHTNIGCTTTVTERLSSRDPNLQNQLKDDDWRKVFIARNGYKLISADFSQVELRLMAQFARDEVMLKAFDDGEDVHDKSAEIIFGKKFTEADEDGRKMMRRFGKTINFSVIYGVSALSLYERIRDVFGEDMPYTEEEVAEFRRIYFSRYKGIGAFIENFPRYVEKEKVLTAPHGNKRRLFLENPKTMTRQERTHKHREGLNFFPQTGAAAITNTSFILIGKSLREKVYPAYLILQIHDQILAEARSDYVDRTCGLMRRIMERPVKEFGGHSYPVDINVGNNWGSMIKWKGG